MHPKCSRVKTCINRNTTETETQPKQKHAEYTFVFCLFVFYYVFIDLLIQSVRKIYVSQKLVSYVNPWKIPVLKLWHS